MPIRRPFLFIIHFERIQYVVNAEKAVLCEKKVIYI